MTSGITDADAVQPVMPPSARRAQTKDPDYQTEI
jgi:hypothetical protein